MHHIAGVDAKQKWSAR